MGTGGNAKDPNRLAAWHNCLSALPTLLYAKWINKLMLLSFVEVHLARGKKKKRARFKMGLIWHKILQVSIISSSPFPLGSAGFKWNRWKALTLISVRHLAHDGTAQGIIMCEGARSCPCIKVKEGTERGSHVVGALKSGDFLITRDNCVVFRPLQRLF